MRGRSVRKFFKKAEPAEDPKRGRGRPKLNKMAIDVAWFQARMKERGVKSFAELARSLGIDKGMMSKSLNSQRIFGPAEIVKLAEALATTTDEIFSRLGYAIEPRGVLIIGKITATAQVSFVATQKGEIYNLPGASAQARGLIVEGLKGYEGAVVVYIPAAQGKVQPVITLGQLGIIEADDYLTPMFGAVVRGARGKYDVELAGTGDRKALSKLLSVAPVQSVHFI